MNVNSLRSKNARQMPWKLFPATIVAVMPGRPDFRPILNRDKHLYGSIPENWLDLRWLKIV